MVRTISQEEQSIPIQHCVGDWCTIRRGRWGQTGNKTSISGCDYVSLKKKATRTNK